MCIPSGLTSFLYSNKKPYNYQHLIEESKIVPNLHHNKTRNESLRNTPPKKSEYFETNTSFSTENNDNESCLKIRLKGFPRLEPAINLAKNKFLNNRVKYDMEKSNNSNERDHSNMLKNRLF